MDNDALKAACILIVDDEAANVRLLERLLQRDGYANFKSTTDARQVASLYAECSPDLILLDLRMPHLDGFGVMDQLRPQIPADAYLPILILTADITPAAKQRALAGGAKDFLAKPFDATEALLRIKNLLETRRLHQQLQRHNEFLEEEVSRRTHQLLQTEKLATMGELLAGVAHELNNPLGVAMGQADLVLMQAGDGPLTEQLRKIRQACARCARIVKNFLAMARQHPPERQSVSLNQIVRDAVELLAYQLRVDKVEVGTDLAADLPVLWADPHQLHQVLVNLIVNAHHAMREKPLPRTLTLTTRADGAQGRVALEVADTGAGIPPDIQARIFEPFFTTKATGVGTGLGLSLCQGIVEGHGGTIRVRSQVGQGTTFGIELPVEAPPEFAMPPEAVAAPAARGQAILVVDDEPEMAALIADMLSADGYRVATAANGAVALDKLRERPCDLILSDIRMPELDGPGLYREIQRLHPALLRRVIFLTGDALNPKTNEFVEQTGAPGLSKPFTLEELRRVVQQTLRTGPRDG